MSSAREGWWDVISDEYPEEGVLSMQRARSATEAIAKHRASEKCGNADGERPEDFTAHRTESVMLDLLALVGRRATLKQICSWTRKQINDAGDWAAAVHLDVSDNRVKVPTMPRCVRVLPEMR